MNTTKQRVLLVTAPSGVTKINTTHFNRDSLIRESLISLAYAITNDAYDQKESHQLIKNFFSEIQNLRLITKVGEQV